MPIRYRVFLFPFAGGNAVFYHSWRTLFPDDVDVVAIQLPGHGNRIKETPLQRMEDIVSMLTSEIRGQLETPYLFFGHSMGAAVAYQLALQLRKEDLTVPEHLFLSGRRAPHIDDPNAPRRHLLSQDELLDWSVSTGGFPRELISHQDMVDTFMEALAADMKALEMWQEEFRLSAPLFVPFTVYSASEDPEVNWEQVKPWTELSGLKSRTRLFAGGHFYLKDEAKAIADEILQCINT